MCAPYEGESSELLRARGSFNKIIIIADRAHIYERDEGSDIHNRKLLLAYGKGGQLLVSHIANEMLFIAHTQ